MVKLKTQKEIFDAIVRRFKTKAAMYIEIAGFMNITVGTVEKWAAGKTELDYGRLCRLIEKYELGLTEVCAQNIGYVISEFVPLKMTDLTKYKGYIQSLANLLEKQSIQDEVEILFMADEIPIFHFMPYKNLTYFKLYSYYCDMQKGEDDTDTKPIMKYEDFTSGLDKFNLEEDFAVIYESYEKIASKEIWDDTVLDSLLQKMKNLKALDRFRDPGAVKLILGELTDLIATFRKKANSGKKSSGVRFDFFMNPAPIRNGGMLVKSPAQNLLVSKLDTINSTRTNDVHLIDMFKSGFYAKIAQSDVFGMGNESKRFSFYNGLLAKINKIK